MDVGLPTKESAYAPMQSADVLRKVFGIMTAYELAQALEVTTETLGTWRNKDQGPKHVKLGKQVFYRLADVWDWIDEQAGDVIEEDVEEDTEEDVEEPNCTEPVAVWDPETASDGE
jgi:hypothetical protein